MMMECVLKNCHFSKTVPKTQFLGPKCHFFRSLKATKTDHKDLNERKFERKKFATNPESVFLFVSYLL